MYVDLHAMAYLIIIFAVLFFGLYPSALLRFATGQIDVLSYLMVFSVVAAASQFLLLAVTPKFSSIEPGLHSRVINRSTVGLGIGNAIFNTLAYGSFYLALSLGDAVSATVLLELWASVFLIFTMVFRRESDGGFEHHHGLPTTIGFFTLGILGVVMVASAEVNSLLGEAGEPLTSSQNALALVAGVAAPILMATSFMIGTRNARTVSGQLCDEVKIPVERSPDEPPKIKKTRANVDYVAGIYHGAFLRFFATAILLVVLPTAWLMFGWRPELASTDLLFISGVVLCALISSAGSTLANIANNISRSSNLNLIWAFSPFLGVILLRAFGYADSTPATVFFGAILILAANFMLTTKTQHSASFRFSILALCGLAFIVLFVPPLREEASIQYVALPLGVFGILAAFFIDRVARSHPNQREPTALFAQNIFTLWILGFGSILTMALFREMDVLASDMTLVILGVAVVYMCVMPVERLFRRPNDPQSESDVEEQLAAVGLSALFLLSLFVLLLLAMLEGLATR